MGPAGAKRTPNASQASHRLTRSGDSQEQQLLPKTSLQQLSPLMAVLIPRIRTINVRLSEEEYLELERFCAASGARSISDLVRSTMHNVVRGGDRESVLASSINEQSAHMKYLQQRVEELAAELVAFRAGAPPSSASEAGGRKQLEEVEPTIDTHAEISSAPAEQPLRKLDASR